MIEQACLQTPWADSDFLLPTSNRKSSLTALWFSISFLQVPHLTLFPLSSGSSWEEKKTSWKVFSLSSSSQNHWPHPSVCLAVHCLEATCCGQGSTVPAKYVWQTNPGGQATSWGNVALQSNRKSNLIYKYNRWCCYHGTIITSSSKWPGPGKAAQIYFLLMKKRIQATGWL